MKSIRQRALAGELLSGTWLNLGSTVSAEIAARSGFDWLLIDLEHGSGSDADLLGQLQAVDTGASVPIVRIAWNEGPRFKRTLNSGAAGIMVPYVNTAEEARAAAAAMRYPPQGTRGAARLIRANGYGRDLDAYLAEANEKLLTVVQIETVEAVSNAEAIAAVEGVDVLFVGPFDLSVSLGIPGQLQHPDFRRAITHVIDICRRAGKSPGTLLASAEGIPDAVADGYRFLAAGSDAASVSAGLTATSRAFASARGGR